MINKLIIGTVQFGLDYGITNVTGIVSKNELDTIFKFCNDKNIIYFDTAQDYGKSEDIISKYKKYYSNFKIITKGKFINNNFDLIINKSLNKFDIIDYFLLHSFSEYSDELINKLDHLKKLNKIKKIGVSVYTVDEAIKLLDDLRINTIQIPFNYIDIQWDNEIFLSKINSRPDIEIHVRSIFLQGILLNPIVKKPINIEQIDFDLLNKIIDELILEFNMSKLEFCFAYINSFDWINKFLIGIDNYSHLELNYNIINKNLKLSNEQLLIIKKKIKNINKLICNPSQWKF